MNIDPQKHFSPESEYYTSIISLDKWVQNRNRIDRFYSVVNSKTTTDFIVDPTETKATTRLEIMAIPKKGDKPERYVYTVEGKYDDEHKTIQ